MSSNAAPSGTATDGGTSGTTPPASQPEFAPITSQDDLNKIITQRIERERAKFADYADVKAKADQFIQLEEASKSEAQRLSERAEAAEKRANEIEARALRLEVAADKGLTPAQAKRLVGATREELEADADELLDTFKSSGEGPTEFPDLDLGNRGGSTMPLNGDGLEKALNRKLGIS